MPRKVNYGIDYDDDYEDDYNDDYDYDYDEEVEENGITAKTMPAKEVRTAKVWRCPICTYDNEDSMSACDICGILRNPLVKSNIQINDVAVGGKCKDSGVSVMAKSLFASLPQHRVQPFIFEVQDDVSSTDNHLNFHKFRNMRSTFSEFSSAFSNQNHKRVNIAPFKFNVPSPDDLVSSGLQSLKMKSKDNQRDTNIPVELELSAKDQESTSASVTRQRGNGVNEKDYAPTSGSIQGVPHSNVNTEAMSSKTGKVEQSIERKTASISDFTPETWMIPETVDGELSQLNLAIVGHVDSGKSTLSGRLLHLSGRISQKLMHKYEKEAKQQGKGSFAYAWALDESAEERERGITMTVGVAFFTSKKYHIVLLDSPGHRDFVPNMISGATQADAAILVVDASMGSFEAGIDATGGQTREHAQLIRSFGVDQIIVLVNKMDVVGYSKERFDFVKQKLGTFLRTCGFKESSISWVPASVMENQNLVANSSDARLSWYRGPFLMDAIDSLQLPARDYSKPLQIPICDVKSQSQSQVSACGKLETGAIRPGLKVLVMPSKEIATVRSLERDSQPCSIARAGDNVTVNLQGIEGNRVTAGSVICHPDYPVQVASQLEMKILVLEISTPIVIGSQLEFHIHHAKEAAKIVKILSLLDPKTGKVTKKSPRCLLSKQNAMVEVALQGPVCVEEYSSCRALGRVFLRASGRTIGLGVVTQIIKREN
ncbi:HBS1-like protein isoform X1 [Salvia hispanica]|uniref:HBS1-like protein isoform X1 n=1 Tax=Salvia hispanica TaxID=49212 RepID=UPI002009D8B0|nr:HBS1-like protein isoform X1 [Salvia hispanica]